MNELLLKNARIVDPVRNVDKTGDVGVSGGKIADPASLDELGIAVIKEEE